MEIKNKKDYTTTYIKKSVLKKIKDLSQEEGKKLYRLLDDIIEFYFIEKSKNNKSE